MGQDDTKNLILAAVLSMIVVFGWYTIFPPPPPAEQPVAANTPAGTAATGDTVALGNAGDNGPVEIKTREGALADSERIEIRSPSVTGSLMLQGGRIDDLHLVNYRETLDKQSDTVVLLNPVGGPKPYYIDFGWVAAEGTDAGEMPGKTTPWVIESGDVLTPETPVTLTWDNGKGLIFRRQIALDKQYMFTIRQSVENTTDKVVNLVPFSRIARLGLPDSTGLFILHEGGVAVIDGKLTETDYDDLEDLPPNPESGARYQHHQVLENGWLGFTDKYWMTSVIAKPGQAFNAYYQVVQRGAVPEFQALMRAPVMVVAAGASATSESMLFAGAKEFNTLRGYEKSLGIVDFVNAIDWGWFYFLTKPIFQLLGFVYGLIGNMGFAIIALTLLIKSILFPLAYKSYVSMSKMKKLQPEMEKIKERCGDDRQKMQQEVMALYKKEKVNPASGCLPILLQIPIFFSLYKVLFVTIEMRHAPFIGWIKDLSAPDPTSIINLFGLLPWDAPDPSSFLAILSIGVYPIIMGVTMWLQQKLNPAPTDQTQAMIFAWMPWVFMFMLGSFASGLVIYWCANNILTFTQQYAIMRSQGVDVDFFGNVKKTFKRKPKES